MLLRERRELGAILGLVFRKGRLDPLVAGDS
jgi:hypothetical protein